METLLDHLTHALPILSELAFGAARPRPLAREFHQPLVQYLGLVRDLALMGGSLLAAKEALKLGLAGAGLFLTILGGFPGRGTALRARHKHGRDQGGRDQGCLARRCRIGMHSRGNTGPAVGLFITSVHLITALVPCRSVVARVSLAISRPRLGRALDAVRLVGAGAIRRIAASPRRRISREHRHVSASMARRFRPRPPGSPASAEPSIATEIGRPNQRWQWLRPLLLDPVDASDH